MTNAVFMPYVLEFNRRAVDEKLARVAAYLGLQPSYSAFLDFVMKLRADLGVPHTLKEFGVTNPDIPLMATMSPNDPTAGATRFRSPRKPRRIFSAGRWRAGSESGSGESSPLPSGLNS